MDATKTDPVSVDDDDTALIFVSAEKPDPFLDTFMEVEFLDCTDELLALFEVRHQLERRREAID